MDSSPFPAGLRVLVVDDDPTWLKILEKMLRKCSYEVTTCGLARVALEMLREKRDRFDIVISDVNMPDMDGFKLLEHVGLEMDLPVIMMSVDGETSRVMKGVQHGACDYLLKPIRMKELRNIWQHVFRKKIHEVKEVESHDGIEEFQLISSRINELDDTLLFSGNDLNFSKKRKDLTNKEFPEQDFLDLSTVKKARVVWSVDLHQKFVNAVNQIGFDKVGPKKILDLMNVPGLTRENVASHLQKYRLYLSRLQKENDGLAYGGPVQSDSVSKDNTGSFSFQNPTAMQNNSDMHTYSNERVHARGLTVDSKEHFDHGSVKEEKINTMATKGTESPKTKGFPELGRISAPPEVVGANTEIKPHEHATANLQNWNRGPDVKAAHCHVQQHDLFNLVSGYPCKQHLEDKGLAGNALPTNSSVATSGWDEVGSATPSNIDCRKTKVTNIPSSKINSTPNQSEARGRGVYGPLTNSINIGVKSGKFGSSTARSHYPDQYLIDLIESSSQASNLMEDPANLSSPENAQCSHEGYGYFGKDGIGGFEILQYDSLSPTYLPGNLDDGLHFDCDYVIDFTDYPSMNGGLFT